MTDTNAELIEVAHLVTDCRQVLAEQDAAVVGAALGELLATYIAGHHPIMRDQALDMVVKLARDLVPAMVEEMIHRGRCGPDWRGAPS
jgi:hypothetical protein